MENQNTAEIKPTEERVTLLEEQVKFLKTVITGLIEIQGYMVAQNILSDKQDVRIVKVEK